MTGNLFICRATGSAALLTESHTCGLGQSPALHHGFAFYVQDRAQA